MASIVFLAATTASGSGFSIFEQGAKATGMGGAFTAMADDPSAIFYNVAGIAQQRELRVLAGATLIQFTNEFTGNPDDPFTTGTTGEYEPHRFVPANVYVVVPLRNNLTAGFGAFSAFGMRTDWKDPWIGRFVSHDTNLKSFSVQPSIAWMTAEGRLAIGAGVEYRRARVVLQRNEAALDPFVGRIVDAAHVHLGSDWGSGISWNVGVLAKPAEHWRFGAHYRAPLDVDLRGEADFTPMPTGNPQFDAAIAAQLPRDQSIRTTIAFPAMASIGIATSAIAKWDIELDVTWASWSRFESLEIDFETAPDLVRRENWSDTFAFRLGANRRIGADWDVRFGGLYDQNAQPDQAVSPLLPDADRIGVSLGLGYQRGPVAFDVSHLILHFRDRSTSAVNADAFTGTYQTDSMLTSFNVGYRF